MLEQQTIHFYCPYCSQVIEINTKEGAQIIGRNVACNHCEKPLIVSLNSQQKKMAIAISLSHLFPLVSRNNTLEESKTAEVELDKLYVSPEMSHADTIDEVQVFSPGELVTMDEVPALDPSMMDKQQSSNPHIIKADIKKSNRRFGRYNVYEEVGRGGVGKVYRAHDPENGQIVALKMLIEGPRASEENEKRFLLEARSTAKLNHPNIVKVYDIGYEMKRYYFTMEYVEGPSLRELLKIQGLKGRKIIEIMIKISSGIAHAHSKGIIHRDLKPGNVMMLHGEEPKVMDFGLAKLAESSIQLTATGMIMGTLAYMAPEQAYGDSNQVDHRSDVYSLGAMLYEMVSRRTVFNEKNPQDFISKILHAEPTPLIELVPKIPEKLSMVCSRALAKDKTARYQTAHEFMQELQAIIGTR